MAVRDRRIYQFADGKIPTNELWMNYGYFDETLHVRNGTVTLYFARIGDRQRSADFGEHHDGLFANSTFETQTQNERDWLRARINQIGDMAFFIRGIMAALFTLLILTGNR